MSNAPISREQIDALWRRLKREAESAGYYLNPDEEFSRDLVQSLLINQARYGYWACPCRLAQGKREDDRDIICPCDYRDADLNDFDACYCALYVSREIAEGKKEPHSIPERRNQNALTGKQPQTEEKPRLEALSVDSITLPFPVWRCRVCGYLCARETPPKICPICKASQDRFERFL